MVTVAPLPPNERYPGRPPEGRLIVIAPTRAACETIELALQLRLETLLEREHGVELPSRRQRRDGFGIVAGTGTGKTLAIRPIAEEILRAPLRVGVVNREREATPETPTWNVVIVTTGIARRWLQDGLITGEDVIVVDEIHQTSAELELCLALAKRAGCRFIWLSATVDPSFYAEYLGSAAVLQTRAFDPAKAARVTVVPTLDPLAFLDARFLRRVVRQKRGVAVFVPTRAEAEAIAEAIGQQWPAIRTEFYHGGEPIGKLRAFLEGEVPRPYLLAMTAAGQSSINVPGLDTVVILDAQFASVVRRGRPVLTRMPLGPNEILQMAGRVHGRVADGEVWILSERTVVFEDLEPVAPNFQLAGDPERVALTCAAMGVRADELDLPVPLDRAAYRRALERLEARGLVRQGRLTAYGRQVEVLPVDRPWGELLVHAEEELLPVVATVAALESLHRMTRAERAIERFVVPGSDHLTAYRLYQAALERCGSLGQVWGLPRHVFDPESLQEWAERHGVLVRAIEDGAVALASIYRALDRPLPERLPPLTKALVRAWQDLVARVMPFDLVIDEETAHGEVVQVAPTSVCGRWGPVAGTIRYFADRLGRPRGSIEGTQLSYRQVWAHSEETAPTLVVDPTYPRAPLRRRRTRHYHGFVLEAQDEPIDGFPPGEEEEARRQLARAVAFGGLNHRDARRVREGVRTLRELIARSGGRWTWSEEDVVAHLAAQLTDVRSYQAFLQARLAVDLDAFLPAKERRRLEALPDALALAGEDYPLSYGLEDGQPVARVRVPERVVRRLREEDVPPLDRPLRWVVTRGARPALHAASLADAQAQLAAFGVRLGGR